MSNFDFIKESSKTGNLYDFCEKAESFVFSYPEISATEARKANELCIKMVFETATGVIPDGLSTFDMLETHEFKSYFSDSDLVDYMHRVRRIGNKAAHGEKVSEQEAIEALEKLHRIVGEICYILYIIDDFPNFDISKAGKNDHTDFDLEESIVINTEYLEHLRLMKKYSMVALRKPRSFINVHVEPKKKEGRVDSAANNRLACEAIYNFLVERLPKCEVLPDLSGQKIKIVCGTSMKTIAVKSGCSVLGKRAPDGSLSILPGIDLILYTPCITDSDIINQYRVFTANEFYTLWEKLGLIRLKVSNSVSRLLKDCTMESSEKQIDQYADTVSVQSFTNSGKKKVLVAAAMNSYPTLANDGIQIIELMLASKGHA